MNNMTLREICKNLGISRRAIQGYEKAGLVYSTGRNHYGHLLYNRNAQERIRRIKLYQRLGFKIREIKNIIDAPDYVVKEAVEERVIKLKEEKKEIVLMIKIANKLIACEDLSTFEWEEKNE